MLTTVPTPAAGAHLEAPDAAGPESAAGAASPSGLPGSSAAPRSQPAVAPQNSKRGGKVQEDKKAGAAHSSTDAVHITATAEAAGELGSQPSPPLSGRQRCHHFHWFSARGGCKSQWYPERQPCQTAGAVSAVDWQWHTAAQIALAAHDGMGSACCGSGHFLNSGWYGQCRQWLKSPNELRMVHAVQMAAHITFRGQDVPGLVLKGWSAGTPATQQAHLFSRPHQLSPAASESLPLCIRAGLQAAGVRSQSQPPHNKSSQPAEQAASKTHPPEFCTQLLSLLTVNRYSGIDMDLCAHVVMFINQVGCARASLCPKLLLSSLASS